MKATELRIGNWLMSDGVPVQVDGRTIFDFWHYGENGVIPLRYEPMPLTEERLERFGFIPNPYNDTYIKGSFTLNCDKTRGKLELWPDNVTGKVVYIKYAHKLQNLFFEIEGEELQLK